MKGMEFFIKPVTDAGGRATHGAVAEEQTVCFKSTDLIDKLLNITSNFKKYVRLYGMSG